MNHERAGATQRSRRYRRLAAVVSIPASILALATVLAAPHLSAAASRDLIASIHAAWIHIAAPGMQFPAGRVSSRDLKIWLGVIAACCFVRINSRFVQSL